MGMGVLLIQRHRAAGAGAGGIVLHRAIVGCSRGVGLHALVSVGIMAEASGDGGLGLVRVGFGPVESTAAGHTATATTSTTTSSHSTGATGTGTGTPAPSRPGTNFLSPC